MNLGKDANKVWKPTLDVELLRKREGKKIVVDFSNRGFGVAEVNVHKGQLYFGKMFHHNPEFRALTFDSSKPLRCLNPLPFQGIGLMLYKEECFENVGGVLIGASDGYVEIAGVRYRIKYNEDTLNRVDRLEPFGLPERFIDNFRVYVPQDD